MVMRVFIPYHRDELSDNGLYSVMGLNGTVVFVLWIVEDALHRAQGVASLLVFCLGLLKGVKHLGT